MMAPLPGIRRGGAIALNNFVELTRDQWLVNGSWQTGISQYVFNLITAVDRFPGL
jgi:hypothetical protein